MRSIRTMRNTVLPAPPYPHFDVDAIWDWFLQGLAEAADEVAVDVIAVTTHGAAIALLGEDGARLPVLDYEHPGPDTVADDYRQVRGAFSEILSPDLPGAASMPGASSTGSPAPFRTRLRRRGPSCPIRNTGSGG